MRVLFQAGLLTKIMKDELAALMGSEHSEISLAGSPTVILIAGLQGYGVAIGLESMQTAYGNIVIEPGIFFKKVNLSL